MQSNFNRNEKKYIISKEQCIEFQKLFSQYMKPDQFGENLVQNLYFDTENWDVIRTSIEKPLYKEKLRLRCYDMPNKESTVFLELKKKFKGIVYKRRIALPFRELSYRSVQDLAAEESSQISQELCFYIKRNSVFEKVYISFKRTAFTGREQKDLRVTFDSDIRFRLEKLDFFNPDYGTFLLPKNTIVMEIKAGGGMPLWMAHTLCEHKVFPVSFSKYGKCYTGFIIKQPEFKNKETLSA